jgi:choline dehydrogenase
MSTPAPETSGKTYDYIIVGAGSAGCVLAYRLSADPAVTVLLVEAGGRDAHPFIHMPRGLAKIIGNLKLIWPFATEADKVSGAAGEVWARGRMLGGSSGINGMMYVRGQAADFDALAEQTSADWDWSHVAQAYKALEDHELGAAASRGAGGPLHVSMPTNRTALTEALIAAGEALGLRRQEDVNAPEDNERVGYAPRTIRGGRRESAATAFLNPIRARPNLTVVTGVAVDRIVIEDGSARAITGTRDGKPVSYRTSGEIVLAAGALASPAILQRSGIGDPALLAAHGIPLVADSRGVGENLREHRGVVMQWRVRDDVSENRQYRGLRLLANAARYFVSRTGPMADAAYEIGAWFRSAPGLARPDAQFLIAPYSFDYTAGKPAVEPWGGFNICVYMVRPKARGTVKIRSADPAILPQIDANAAGDAEDNQLMITLMRQARRFVAQAPLAKYVEAETRPGPVFQTDDELREAHRLLGYGNYHACGTCRMGADEAAVVDPRLKVRGVLGLRVADTAVFPFMLAGNTQAPAMAVAWRAADLILEDAVALTRRGLGDIFV